MKILHVIDSAGFYGAEAMLLDLMIAQRKLGHGPILCSIGNLQAGEKEIEEKAQGLEIRVVRTRMRDGLNLLGAWRILDLARRVNANVIHSHGYKGNILLGSIPRAIRSRPLVATIHGWTNTGSLNRMRLYQWLDSMSLGRIDAVVAVSHGMLSHPKLRQARPSKLHVIPNGVSDTLGSIGLAPGAEETPRALDAEITRFCRRGAFVLGAIGRLSIEKGYLHLIEALSLLVRQGENYRLVIIGEGRQRRELEEAVTRAGLSDRVLLPGYLESARHYLTLFDAFVQPSLTEGMPIALMEAMLAGIPVIASAVGGIPELLQEGKCGLLAPPRSAKTIADAIRLLAGDAGIRAAYAACARQNVLNNYSARRMAEEYLKVYQSLEK